MSFLPLLALIFLSEMEEEEKIQEDEDEDSYEGDPEWNYYED